MAFTSIKSVLPDKAKIDKLKNVKSKQDLKNVLIIEKLKNNYWTAIPNKILFNEGLSEGAKILWAILQSVGDPEGRSFYGQKTLAVIVGKSTRTIQRHITELKKSGWIEAKSGGYNRSNNYFVIFPAGCQNPKLKSAIKKSKDMSKRY